MKKFLLGLTIGLSLVTGSAYAFSLFQVIQGGTGAATLTGCLTGNGTGAITANGTCATFAWPFTSATTFTGVSTSTLLNLSGGVMSTASSTLQNLFVGTLTHPSLTSSGLAVNSSGVDYAAATTTFTGTAPIALTYLNGQVTGTCAVATASVPGCLAAADFTIFAGKASFPFISVTTYTGVSTSTLINFGGGLMSIASSTLQNINLGAITIPSITSASIAVNASGVVYGAATSTNAAFTFATSSLGSGTTTIPMAGFFGGTKVTQFGCTGSGGGTFTSTIGTGAATSSYVVSATGFTTTYTALASNNSFGSGITILWAFGGVSGTVANPSCSWARI